MGALNLTVRTFSRSGHGRGEADNQDALYSNPNSGVFAIADGVGSPLYEAGEASQFAMRTIAKLVERKRIEADVPQGVLSALFMSIHENLRNPQMSKDEKLREMDGVGEKQPGTTLATLLIGEEHANVAWVGSDRLYAVTAEGLTLVTTDDTEAFLNAMQGHYSLDEAKTHTASANSLRNVLGGWQSKLVREHEIRSVLTELLRPEQLEQILGAQGVPKVRKRFRAALSAVLEGFPQEKLREYIVERMLRGNIPANPLLIRGESRSPAVSLRKLPTSAIYRFLLATDGLHGALLEEEIADILTREHDIDTTAAKLGELWHTPQAMRRYFPPSSYDRLEKQDDASFILIDVNGGLPRDRILPRFREPYLLSTVDFVNGEKFGLPTTTDLRTARSTADAERERIASALTAAQSRLRELESQPKHPDLSRLVTNAINDLVVARLATQPTEVHLPPMMPGIVPTSMAHYNPTQEVYVLADVPSKDPVRAGAALMAADLVAAALAVRRVVNPSALAEAIADARSTFHQRFPLLPLEIGAIACTDDTIYTYHDEGVAVGILDRSHPEPHGTDANRVELFPRAELRRAYIGTAKGTHQLGIERIAEALAKDDAGAAVRTLATNVRGTYEDRVGVGFFIAPLEPRKADRERAQALERDKANLSMQVIALTTERDAGVQGRSDAERAHDNLAEQLIGYERRLAEHSEALATFEITLRERDVENADLHAALATQGNAAAAFAEALPHLRTYGQAGQVIKHLTALLEDARKRLRDTAAELTTVKARDDRAQVTIDTLAHGYLKTYRRETAAMQALRAGNSAVADLTEQLGTIEGKLQGERERAGLLTKQLSAAEQNYATAEQARTAAEEKAGKSEFEVFKLDMQLKALVAELEARKRDGGELSADLTALREEHGNLERAHGEVQGEYEAARGTLATVQRSLELAEQALGRTQTTLEESQGQNAGYRAKLRAQRDTLRAVRAELAKPSALEEQLTSYRTAVEGLIAKDTEFRERTARKTAELRQAIGVHAETLDTADQILSAISTEFSELRTAYTGALQQAAEETERRATAEQQLRDMTRINYDLIGENAQLAARVQQSEYVMGAFQTVAGIVRSLITGTPIQPPTAPQGTSPARMPTATMREPEVVHQPISAPRSSPAEVPPAPTQAAPLTPRYHAQPPAHEPAPAAERMAEPVQSAVPPPYAQGQSIDFATKNLYGLPTAASLGIPTEPPKVLPQYRRELVTTQIDELNEQLEAHQYRTAEPTLVRMLGLHLSPEERPAHPLDSGLQYSSPFSKQSEAVAYSNLGVILAQRGESEKAKSCFDMAMGIAQQLDVMPWTIARNARTAERFWPMPRAA